ncbi:MAG: DegT/DnrJ/EryC1/StrS family aminotransferase, partial [Dehalococcoidia bacterium]
MPVPLLDLRAQYESIRGDIDAALQRVLESQQFILGEEVNSLEREVAGYLGVSHAVGVASGTDALLLALRGAGVGPGDEVLVPSFTFFATAGAVVNVGARPVFVDIEPTGFGVDPARLEEHVTARTRALMVVHLFGQCVDVRPLQDLAQRHGWVLIEDAAQAIGATLGESKAGSLGASGCFSFFPTKNLGAFGDGGLVATSDDDLAARLRRLRMHGEDAEYRHRVVGYNSRLDALQAAVLRAKLPHLDSWNSARRRNAQRYHESFQATGLCDGPQPPLRLPQELPDRRHVFHQYVIRAQRRDELRHFLQQRQIATGIYYPVPLHQQECFREGVPSRLELPRAEEACGEVLALP